MAGESVLKVKKWEQEAVEIVNDARSRAKKIIQKADEAEADLFKKMDERLQKEETGIKQKYEEDTEKSLQHLKQDEQKHRETIHTRCKASLQEVVDYIAREIAKV